MHLGQFSAQAAEDARALREEPLAQPFARGKTLFELLPPEKTGVRIENRYADPRMWGDLYQEFENGSMGSGVAIGDYDGDGLPDIFVASKTEGCHLFRNLGDYKFEDVTEKAGVGGTQGVWNEGVTFVDVNNDGLLDIYVCRFNAPNLLFINQGDGTFREMAHSYGLDVVDSSVMASFCDYDRDGRLDVYITTNLLDHSTHPEGQRGYLFHNNGNGTFTDVTLRAGITGESQSHSAIWWDYDNDGWPDLYVANDFGVPDKLYHNNKDGTFSNLLNQVLSHTSFSSMGSDVADPLNNGYIGLIVADMAESDHVGRQRSPANSAAAVDVGTRDSNTAPKVPRNMLFVNTGTPYPLEVGYLAGVAATGWTWSPRFEDLDNDGRLDLFVTNGMNRDQYNVDTINRVLSAETLEERIRIARATPPFPETHLAFQNLGDLNFRSVGKEWGLDQKGIAFGAAFGDLNRDGNLDLVYLSYGTGVSILRNDCNTGHRIDVHLRGSVSNRFGVGATVKVESALGLQVRPLTLARGYLSSSEPMVHFGLGDDTTIKSLTVNWPSGCVQEFNNLPVDRSFTVFEPSNFVRPIPAVQTIAPQFVEVSATEGLNVGTSEAVVDETDQQPMLPVRLNRRGPALAVGDIDETGGDSIVVGGTTSTPIRVLHGSAEGTPGVDEAVDDGPVLLFDSQGTGREDLLVTKGGNVIPEGSPLLQPHLYINQGHGHFKLAPPETLPPFSVSVGAVAAADFDHSGRLGLFIGGRVVPFDYPAAPRSALFANRAGKFVDVTPEIAPALQNVGMVTSAIWSDVDGDGWPDLLLTLEWGTVRYFHNDHGRKLEDWSEKAGFTAAGCGWWTSIAAGDFNGDGRIDYVVGNVGLNTRYRASVSEPALLFFGDFDGGGVKHLIQAFYENGQIYPWVSRRELGAFVPSVFRRFPSNDKFARATLGEIVGIQKLGQATRLAATELRSGVFLSQADGTYKFQELPRMAQVGPIAGIVTGVFSGTGHVDICIAHDAHDEGGSLGRLDGGLGLLLRGDGRGRFTPVPPAESNFVAPGRGKALVLSDLGNNGWPVVVLSRNGDTVMAFQDRGLSGNNPLRIDLHAAPGNPTAVGAVVSVELADGMIEMSEVYAGSSSYSQSAAACFFGYPDANPPKKIHVRWPLGATSTYPYKSGLKRMVLESPSLGRQQ